MPRHGQPKGKKCRFKDRPKRLLQLKGEGQDYAQVIKMLGNSLFLVMCFGDKKLRLGHIRGKMQRKPHKKLTAFICNLRERRPNDHFWILAEDYVLVSLREFQDEKCDIILRYLPEETIQLMNMRAIPDTDDCEEDDERFKSYNIHFYRKIEKVQKKEIRSYPDSEENLSDFNNHEEQQSSNDVSESEEQRIYKWSEDENNESNEDELSKDELREEVLEDEISEDEDENENEDLEAKRNEEQIQREYDFEQQDKLQKMYDDEEYSIYSQKIENNTSGTEGQH